MVNFNSEFDLSFLGQKLEVSGDIRMHSGKYFIPEILMVKVCVLVTMD